MSGGGAKKETLRARPSYRCLSQNIRVCERRGKDRAREEHAKTRGFLY